MDARAVPASVTGERRMHKLVKNSVFTQLAEGGMERASRHVLRLKPAVRMQAEPNYGHAHFFKIQEQLRA